jgi:arsenate reductase (glutaredoxin)
MFIVYAYKGCSTCKNAVKWLKQNSIEFEERPIRETPPSVTELSRALEARAGNLRLLFNTSGLDYRALGLSEKLPKMSHEEALSLLANNGNLVKRPFVVDSAKGVSLIGFKEAEWAKTLLHG